MAEVSTCLHFFHQPIINVQEQDSDLYAFDFDPLSPPNISFFLPSDSDSLSDSDPNCFDGAQEDQMIFVTDLFRSREEQEEFAVDDDHDLTRDVNYRVLDVWSYREELGLGSRIEFDSVAVEPELGEPSSSIRAAMDGLRVVGNESDSDSDSEEVVQGVNSEDPIRDSDIPLFLDCLVFDEQRSGNEELEWEEVNERVYEGEGLSSVIDRIEESSVSSVVSSNEEIGEELARNFEWEVILAVNNWERAPQFEHQGDSDGVSYLAFQDDYTYAAEYDTLFGHFVQNESVLKGSPPASKSVVENLPTLMMTKEMLQENMVCAVCKDDILVEEKVTRLPCCHHYHGDCIVPWLSIRNTCPVCRHELPTDDLDYEQRKTQTGGLGLSQDLQILEFIYRVVEGW